MLVDFSEAVKSIDGTEIKFGDQVFTLKKGCMDALLAIPPQSMPGQKPDPRWQLTGEQKFKQHKLAKRIFLAETAIEVSAEDMKTIKEAVGFNWPTPICGAIWEMLSEVPANAAAA